MTKKKLGFSLSGGGARGIAHVGFLQAMEDNGIFPDVVTGCSMGAVVGGCYLAGVSLKTLKNKLTKLTKKELIDFNIGFMKNRSVFSCKKMRELLSKYVGKKDIEELNKPFGCIATDLICGTVCDLTRGDAVTAIMASAAIPTVFEPVEIGGKLLVDGGVLLRNPISLCRKLGADKVVGVDVIGELSVCAKPDRFFDVGVRTFSVIDDYYCKDKDVKRADLMVYPDTSDIPVFDFKNLTAAYESGYKEGVKKLVDVKQLIA